MGIAEQHTLTERQRCWLEQHQACEISGKAIAEYAMDQGIEAKEKYLQKTRVQHAGATVYAFMGTPIKQQDALAMPTH